MNKMMNFLPIVALAAAFIPVWVSLGVGIFGPPDRLEALMVFGVLAVGGFGAIIARFQPQGMARALFATALAQALVGVIALIAGSVSPAYWPREIILNGFFVALFVGSALLFRNAAGAISVGRRSGGLTRVPAIRVRGHRPVPRDGD